MNYTPVLAAFAGIFFFIGIQHLLIGFVSKQRSVNLSFGLLTLVMAGFEVNSIVAIKATNVDSFVHSFKLIWFFLFLVQVAWVSFVSVLTKIIYKKFIFLFALLSLLAIVLNLLLPTGLMRGEIIGFCLKMSRFNEHEAYITTKFSVYSILEFTLIILLNAHSITVLLQYFRGIHIRYSIWLIISFVVLLVAEVNDFLVMARVSDFYLVHLGYMCVTLTMAAVLLRNYIESVNSVGELEFEQKKWRTQEEILHMIVHDFKMPLNVLMNMSASQSREDIINTVSNHTKKMEYHLLDILAMNKQDNYALRIRTEKCSIIDIIESAFDCVKYIVRQKRIIFTFESEIEYIVEVDRNHIERTIVNILTNSVKYTLDNGEIKIELYELQNNVLELRIVDNGIGIEKEKLKVVFNKFEFINKPIDTTLLSTGLGLAFCKMALEAHDSNLKLDSVPGIGTSVSFGLKIVTATKLENSFKILERFGLIDVVNMTEAQIKYVSTHYDVLHYCSLNEISVLRKTIKIMENDIYVNREWLWQLKTSCNNFNETSFRILIGMLKP